MSRIQPANPRFMPRTREVLEELYQTWGERTLHGHVLPVGQLAGFLLERSEHPVPPEDIWGADFGFTGVAEDPDYVGDRDAILPYAEAAERAGALVWLDFRPVPPVVEGQHCLASDMEHRISDRDWEAMLTPGTTAFARFRAQVDILGVFVRYLRDAGIVVLLRVCPGMNGRRWWWCGRPGPAGFPGIWRSVYDHFVDRLRLDNVLFVWSPEMGADDCEDYYPGHGMVDLLCADAGPGRAGAAPGSSWLARLRAVGGGRPVGLAGCGAESSAFTPSRELWLWQLQHGRSS